MLKLATSLSVSALPLNQVKPSDVFKQIMEKLENVLLGLSYVI